MYVADHRHGCFLREAKADLDRPIDGMLCMKLHVSSFMAGRMSSTNHSPRFHCPPLTRSTGFHQCPSAHPPSSPCPSRLEHESVYLYFYESFPAVVCLSRGCLTRVQAEVECGRLVAGRFGPLEQVVRLVGGGEMLDGLEALRVGHGMPLSIGDMCRPMQPDDVDGEGAVDDASVVCACQEDDSTIERYSHSSTALDPRSRLKTTSPALCLPTVRT